MVTYGVDAHIVGLPSPNLSRYRDPLNPLDTILPLDVRVLVSQHYFLLSSALAGPEHSLNAPMPDWPVIAARCLVDAPDNQLETSQALC